MFEGVITLIDEPMTGRPEDSKVTWIATRVRGRTVVAPELFFLESKVSGLRSRGIAYSEATSMFSSFETLGHYTARGIRNYLSYNPKGFGASVLLLDTHRGFLLFALKVIEWYQEGMSTVSDSLSSE